MTAITDASSKRALLIGINKYPNFGNRAQLKACINDVNLMKGVLTGRFDFALENITILTDEQATKEAILQAIDELIDATRQDDIIVIYYSGHGSQMRDREGDEPDGYDETIVPYDSGRAPHPNRDISDDEIYFRLLRLSQKTPNITLIFDCCHSGTISRDAFGVNSHSVELDDRPVAELPPSLIDPTLKKQRQQKASDNRWLPIGKRHTLIAACKAGELSYELPVSMQGKKIPYGTLTFFLCRELMIANAGTTYRDIFSSVSSLVTSYNYDQHPQLEGALDREIFGVRDLDTMRFITISQRRKKDVILKAGAAQGLIVGSQWSVYSRDTKRVNDDTSSLGSIEVTEVDVLESKATVITEASDGAITAGSRAVAEKLINVDMEVTVQVDIPAKFNAERREMIAELEDSARLKISENKEDADFCIYLIPPRNEAAEPVPQLGSLSEAKWVVIGLHGQPVMPIYKVTDTDTDATEKIRENLEKWVSYRHTLALKNTMAHNELQGKVAFELMRQTSDKKWVKAVAAKNKQYPVFREGKNIGFRVINNGKLPVYITILDFGLTGAITLLEPMEGSVKALEPGKSIKIGMREGDDIILGKPDNFPFIPYPKGSPPSGGIETVKMFATTRPTDFNIFFQEGVRSIDLPEKIGFEAELFKLFSLTQLGIKSQFTKLFGKKDYWTTVERVFFLE